MNRSILYVEALTIEKILHWLENREDENAKIALRTLLQQSPSVDHSQISSATFEQLVCATKATEFYV